MKRSFASLTLADAMRLIPADQFTSWFPEVKPHFPSDTLLDRFRRFESFDLRSDAGRLLLIDALLVEVVPKHARLKVWKAIRLDSDVLSGFAEYVMSPDYAYLKVPLLCGEQAKGDDYMQAAAQCIAEMVTCRVENLKAGLDIDLFGFVSNGRFWQFYKLTSDQTIFESGQYWLTDLPPLLGMLNFVCAACAANVPARATVLAS